MKIGVLAVQGSFAEHMHLVKGLVEEAKLVRNAKDLEKLSGLIIPGGESTTIGNFLKNQGLSSKIGTDLPIFGSCAGLIVLSKSLIGKQKKDQNLLGRIEIEVERNAYGRQIDSFENDVQLTWSSEPFKGVFIRAPKITKYSPNVKILGSHEKEPVIVNQGNNLACSFHPELTRDTRIHEYFIEEIVKKDKK